MQPADDLWHADHFYSLSLIYFVAIHDHDVKFLLMWIQIT